MKKVTSPARVPSPVNTAALNHLAIQAAYSSIIRHRFKFKMPSAIYMPREDAFAVIRMDPVAMVRHLNDTEALRAAEAMSPRSYLVYVHTVCFLPTRKFH